MDIDIDRSPRRLDADWCRELTPGCAYFTVSYCEPGVNIPEIETLIYLGSVQLEEEDGRSRSGFMFQDARSYQQDGAWCNLPEKRREELSADCGAMSFDEDSVRSVADIDGLLALLNSLRERMRRGLGWERALPEET